MRPTPSAIELQRAMDTDLSNPEEMRFRLEHRRQALMREYQLSPAPA